MSYYKSPSVQIFENTTSSYESAVTGTGVASVGFSTMGPMNELMLFGSYDEFVKKMGKPVPEYPNAHLLARRVLATGAGGFYFVRAGSTSEQLAKKSTVIVTNHTGATVGKYFWKSLSSDSKEIISPYLGVTEDAEGTIELTINLTVGASAAIPVKKTFDVRSNISVVLSDDTTPVIKGIHLDTIASAFNNDSTFSALAVMKSSVVKSDDAVEYGLYIETKGYTTAVGIPSVSNVSLMGKTSSDEAYDGVLANANGGTANSTFTIEAKYYGSGTVGYSVKKYTIVNPIPNRENTFVIEVRDAVGNILETFSGLTLENFVNKINHSDTGSQYVYISGFSYDEADTNGFVDGTYVLGKGTLLPNGVYAYNTEVYLPEAGLDGVPTLTDNPHNLTEVISDLFVNALSEPSLLNLDNVFFSIISVPDSQNSLVQNSAIEVARKRGDAFCVVDVPLDYSAEKATISSAIAWHNGGSELRGSAIESSYAGVYYGWTTVLNEYTNSNINIPPSILVVPRMLAVDASDGVYYAPAGAQRGRVIASDYLYSPDVDDREEMCGGINCINPIIYSNTRGLMIYGQKTADRTGSALNRVNVRRMVNEIKRKLYNRLDEVRFELNNATTQGRARTIASDVLISYKSVGAIENYTVDVNSPGGAERDVLNIYIEFVPVGLVERIRVFLNIAESGVAITEA